MFSVIELALSAHLISLTEPFEFYFTFSAFALAVSLISLLTVPTMYANLSLFLTPFNLNVHP